MKGRLVWAGAGPVAMIFVLAVIAPMLGVGGDAAVVFAIATWVALWWVSEPVPLAVTALLPLVLFPLSGVLTVREAATPYADQIIFLFLGGFLIAGAVESSGLHRRIALRIVAATGSNPRRMVGGFMFAGAFLSMWLSNTATAIMMLPVALAVISQIGKSLSDEVVQTRFAKALLLGIAYSTSIGGVGTLIGTPPNLVLAASIEETFGRSLDFAQWLVVGVPLVLIIVPLAWLYLVRVALPLPSTNAATAQAHLREEYRKLGALTAPEKVVMVVFTATALAWIFRSSKDLGPLSLPGLDTLFPAIKDSTIAVVAAIVLFIVPRGTLSSPPILRWDDAKKIPWDVILLFGGGLCLARAFIESGLAETFAAGLVSTSGVSIIVTISAIIIGTVALTELTSNTATASMLMPLLAAAAVAGGWHPIGLMIAGAVACSFAFCLPVATPPNAVVYGSGKLKIREMVKAGLAMNIIATIAWILLFFLVAAPLLGIDPGQMPDWAATLRGGD